MGLLSKAGGLLLIAGAAVAGNWAGDNLRAATTGESEHRLSLMHTTPEGGTVLGLNLTLTNFIPALILAMLAGRPRTLYAFLSGAVISALVGDRYERSLTSWLQRTLGGEQPAPAQ